MRLLLRVERMVVRRLRHGSRLKQEREQGHQKPQIKIVAVYGYPKRTPVESQGVCLETETEDDSEYGSEYDSDCGSDRLGQWVRKSDAVNNI